MFTRVMPAALLVAAVGWAAPPVPPVRGDKEEPKPGAKDDATTFELRTADDTVMKVTLTEPSLAIATKYGKLTVPAGDVRRLEFGFRYPDGLEAKIEKAVDELGSPEFRTCEDAEQALEAAGRFAIPTLRRATRSENPEVARRAKSTLKTVESKAGADETDLRDYDTIETAEFTIKGRMDLTAMKVRTKYFGETTVKLTDIRSFRSVGSAAGAEFALDAAKYARMNGSEWMATAIEVSAGQQLEVTATGRMDSWPQGPGQYMVGPDGSAGGAGFPPGGAPGGGRIGGAGQVIGRIGPSGAPFAIGSSYKGKRTETGKLYLRIAPSQWNCESTGAYKITVNVTTP